MPDLTQLACRCGRTTLELSGPPILSCECHCTSCRTAGARLQSLPSARAVLAANGGTHFVLCRKDRVRFMQGAEQLKEFRLNADTPTRRVVATCCNTPVFLEFRHGHWLSLYAGLWPNGTAPAIELRTMTSDLPDPSTLPNDVPNSKSQSLSFMAKLLGAWIAMRFRTPKIAVVHGELQV